MPDVFDLLNPDATEVEEQRVVRAPAGTSIGDVLAVATDGTVEPVLNDPTVIGGVAINNTPSGAGEVLETTDANNAHWTAGGGSQPQPTVLFSSDRDDPGNSQSIFQVTSEGIRKITADGVYGYLPVWDRSTYTRCAFNSFPVGSDNGVVAVQDDLSDPASATTIVPDGGPGVSYTPLDWTRQGDLIVFFKGEDIWTVEPDGSNADELIADGETHNGAAFSPDGQQIAYAQIDSNLSTNGVWVMNRDGSSPTLIVEESTLYGDTGNSIRVCGWTPWNRIVFTAANDGPTLADFWACDPDGSNLLNMTEFADATSLLQSPVLTPDSLSTLGLQFSPTTAIKQQTLNGAVLATLVGGGTEDFESLAYA